MPHYTDLPFKIAMFTYSLPYGSVLFYSSLLLRHTHTHTIISCFNCNWSLFFACLFCHGNATKWLFFYRKYYTRFFRHILCILFTAFTGTVRFLLFYKIRFTVKSKAHVSILFACVHEKRLQIFCGNACYRFVRRKQYIAHSKQINQPYKLRWTVSMNKWPLCDGYLNEAILYEWFDVFSLCAASFLIRWFARHLIGTITDLCLFLSCIYCYSMGICIALFHQPMKPHA